ncbi:hypothetical protein GCM10010124_25420 [Pilimelia terevasa]|uniref:ATP/GTP-binding protein n=1 Tax=Pilimelia terevasa TaxID=53372 RepID=A0A8J3FI13_9ACTN|nr:ATP/GTP-binding protein [Pilimelia terevasa]GGK31542.1 hypothetical protein GCM10010124_25420 [Pilimelia terevasa]
MLRHRSGWPPLIAALLLVSSLTALPSAAAADDGGGVVCPPGGNNCTVVITKPGKPGGPMPGKPQPGGGSGPRTCEWAKQEVPCTIPSRSSISTSKTAWFNGSDGCYYNVIVPDPQSGPLWAGHQPGDGAVYEYICYPANAISPLGVGGVGIKWLASPPPGSGAGVSPAVLAARAVNLLPIRGAQIGTAPRRNGSGLVGLPVWLWTTVSPATWGPATASASAGGLTVTATAKASRIQWQMGDGQSVTCTNPGSPYKAAAGGAVSPTCGYVYRTSSKTAPDGKFTVTATTTWDVTWAGGGQTGQLTTTRQASTTLQVRELVVVNG